MFYAKNVTLRLSRS